MLCVIGTIAATGAAGSAASPNAQAANAHRCGVVHARGVTFNVAIVDGHTSCSTARYVISYVLRHGPVTQGSPGREPHGWSCGYGYGREADGMNARGGPSCERGKTIVEGIEARLRPYF
jgi:hypothetical protein